MNQVSCLMPWYWKTSVILSFRVHFILILLYTYVSILRSSLVFFYYKCYLFRSQLGFLPPPIKPSQLAARLIEQAKYEKMQVRSSILYVEVLLNMTYIHMTITHLSYIKGPTYVQRCLLKYVRI